MANGKILKALILEAGEESAGQLRTLLEKEGFEVVGWNKTGVGWMKLYSQHRPQVLFVDLLLPERDGIYCVNKLVSQDPNAICILSHPYVGAYANYIEERALRAGAAAVAQKPIVWSRMKKVLERFKEMLA